MGVFLCGQSGGQSGGGGSIINGAYTLSGQGMSDKAKSASHNKSKILI